MKLTALKKPKKSTQQKIKIVSLLLLIFIICLIILVSAPKAVNLTESKLSDSVNQQTSKPLYLISEVAGVEKVTTPTVNDIKIPPPEFSAEAVLAMDVETGEILYSKNIDKRLSPASITKIMTAVIAQEKFGPGEILTVPPQALVGGSSMGLTSGERLTFRSLLYGMLLNSGNDAAYTIALNYPAGGMDGFLEAMNQRVLELGLKDTHFSNPAGFDSPNHYSSAYDLAQIAKQIIVNQQLSKVVDTQETQIISLDKTKEHNLKNLNKLLSEEGVIGIKTGYTEFSGENLVTLVERESKNSTDSQKHKVLTVVLKSSDRFGESRTLINWIFDNFTWR
ncbi:D-alanyl-D-alanine carboxypeptidase [Candidatus Daviesbacteria bacterium]|nr:D-alanyl-D-alanine carboxypeptidase [Candidatus Daviesbacteria bacterium]